MADTWRATPLLGASRTATKLAYFARFTDELLFGATNVLLPTIRSSLGLSYAQVGLLTTALEYTALVVDPIASLLIDVWQRRWLLALGALAVGASTVLVGLSTTFMVLLVAFAMYGLGAGPLAQTADVVLVEGRGAEAGRIFARATALDTAGALLGPALVGACLWGGVDWRGLLVVLGGSAMAYALAISRTRFPSAVTAPAADDTRGVVARMAANLRTVLADREALYWLLVLRVHYTMEAPFAFRAIWLAEDGGMSQSLVAGYVAFSTACALLGVVVYERWLHRFNSRRLLLGAVAGLVVLFPLWFAAPSTAARFALGAPLAFLFALPWPIAKPASLNTASRRPGAVSAVNSLTGALPITLGVGVLAEAVGLTAASLATHLAGALALLLLFWFMPRGVRERSA